MILGVIRRVFKVDEYRELSQAYEREKARTVEISNKFDEVLRKQLNGVQQSIAPSNGKRKGIDVK